MPAARDLANEIHASKAIFAESAQSCAVPRAVAIVEDDDPIGLQLWWCYRRTAWAFHPIDEDDVEVLVREGRNRAHVGAGHPVTKLVGVSCGQSEVGVRWKTTSEPSHPRRIVFDGVDLGGVFREPESRVPSAILVNDVAWENVVLEPCDGWIREPRQRLAMCVHRSIHQN